MHIRLKISSLIRFYNVKDHLGSTRLVYDTGGSVSENTNYMPYGEYMTHTATTIDKFKFTGKERDNETGYDYFGARYYNNRLGLWNSVDPLKEKYPGWSAYAYTQSDPINFYDPNGKFKVSSDAKTITIIHGSFKTGGELTGYYSSGLVMGVKLFLNDPSYKITLTEVLSLGSSKAIGKGFQKLVKYMPGASQLEKWIVEKIGETSSNLVGAIPDLAGSEEQNDWEQRLDFLAAQEGLKNGMLYSNAGSDNSFNVNESFANLGQTQVEIAFQGLKDGIRKRLDNSIKGKAVSDWSDDEWTRYKEKNNLE